MKTIDFVEAVHSRNNRELVPSLLRMFERFIEETSKDELRDEKNIIIISCFIKMQDIVRILRKHNKLDTAVDIIHPVDNKVIMFNYGSKFETTSIDIDHYFTLHPDMVYQVFFDSPNLIDFLPITNKVKSLFVDKLVFCCPRNKFKFAMSNLFGDRQVKVWKKFTEKYSCNKCNNNFETIERYFDLPSICPKCGNVITT